MSYTIILEKEKFKFSSSHFTILSETTAERLHGHNYQVKCEVSLSSTKNELGMSFDFNHLKPHIQKACETLDEYILVPTKSPYLKIKELSEQYEVQFQKKTYVFPYEDVCLLPISNITVEELAQYMWETIAVEARNFSDIKKMAITVSETQGQSVQFSQNL